MGPLGRGQDKVTLVTYTCPNFANYEVLAYFKKEREKESHFEPLNKIEVGDHIFLCMLRDF